MCVCDLVPAVRFDFFEAKRRDLLAAARRAREHLVTETKENQNQQLAMATWWHEQNISCFWDLKDLSDSIFLCFVFASNTHIKIRCINMGWWNGWEQQATPFWSPRFGQSTAEIYDTTGWVPFLKKGARLVVSSPVYYQSLGWRWLAEVAQESGLSKGHLAWTQWSVMWLSPKAINLPSEHGLQHPYPLVN